MQPFNKIQLVTDQFEDRKLCAELDFQSRSLCTLITRFARNENLRLPEGRGIVICIVTEKYEKSIMLSDGWWFVWQVNDVRNFLAASDDKKQLFIYACIESSFKSIAEKLGKDMLPFFLLLERAKACNGENIWEWKRGKKFSPDKKCFTRVFVNHTMYKYDILLQVFSKNRVLLCERKFTPNIPPDDMLLDYLLGNLVWTGNSEIMIESKIKGEKPMIFHI